MCFASIIEMVYSDRGDGSTVLPVLAQETFAKRSGEGSRRRFDRSILLKTIAVIQLPNSFDKSKVLLQNSDHKLLRRASRSTMHLTHVLYTVPISYLMLRSILNMPITGMILVSNDG